MTGGLALIVDVDSVWLRDPYPFLVSEDGYDIIGQMDGPNLCGGFLLLNGTSTKVRNLWRDMTQLHSEILDKGNSQSEQTLLNKMISSNEDNLSVKHLNVSFFPNGNEYFDLKNAVDPVVIHNNYIKGIDAKIQRFKDFDLWALPES